MRRLFVTTAILLIAGFAPVAAQPAGVAMGDRVRIHGDVRSGAHTLLDATADTLTLQDGAGTTAKVALADIRRMDVSLGRRSAGAAALRGAGYGAAVGVSLGAIAGLLEGDDDPGLLSMSAEGKALLYGVVVGGMGALAGGAVGLAVPGERWRRIELPAVGVAPSSDGGFALSFTRRF